MLLEVRKCFGCEVKHWTHNATLYWISIIIEYNNNNTHNNWTHNATHYWISIICILQQTNVPPPPTDNLFSHFKYQRRKAADKERLWAHKPPVLCRLNTQIQPVFVYLCICIHKTGCICVIIYRYTKIKFVAICAKLAFYCCVYLTFPCTY